MCRCSMDALGILRSHHSCDCDQALAASTPMEMQLRRPTTRQQTEQVSESLGMSRPIATMLPTVSRTHTHSTQPLLSTDADADTPKGVAISKSVQRAHSFKIQTKQVLAANGNAPTRQGCAQPNYCNCIIRTEYREHCRVSATTQSGHLTRRLAKPMHSKPRRPSARGGTIQTSEPMLVHTLEHG